MNTIATSGREQGWLGGPAKVDRIFMKLIAAGWAVPAVFILNCFAYYLRARLELGFWPTYGNPDPKTLGWMVQHLSIIAILLAVYPALFWSGTLSLILAVNKRRTGIWALITIIIITISLHLAAKLSAVDEFLAWFID